MKHKRFWITAAIVLALDRLSKQLWADAQFGLIPSVLAFHGTRNTGVAFGMLGGSVLVPVLTAALIGLGTLWYFRARPTSRAAQYGAGLLLGGALGNLMDRVFLGYVIDFIDPIFLHWFICNLADIAITCGTALLMISLLIRKDEKHP